MAKSGPKPRPVEDRFWDHVDRGAADECWEWAGARQHGYGFIFVSNRPTRFLKAHRVSWEIHNGRPIPEGRSVLHHCDNPPCVNPLHLYVGGNKENARDRAERKRGKEHRQQGEANDNAKLRESDVLKIIAALKAGLSQTQVARAFGVKQPQISRIARRKSWKHLWEERP